MTGINSALGPITAACPGDRQEERDRRLIMLSYRPVSHTGPRDTGEAAARKKLSERKTGEESGEREMY